MKRSRDLDWVAGDWLKDRELRSVSLAARGLWMDMLCLMCESSRKGFLQQRNGNPLPPEMLAKLAGAHADEVIRLLTELETSGVFSRTGDGVIFSRRIVRDENRRLTNRENGKRGGNPRLSESDNRTSNRTPNRHSNRPPNRDGPAGLSPRIVLDSSEEDCSWKTGKTIPPSQEDVVNYCAYKKSPIDPVAFWNFYESKGWMIGKNRMKDWHRAVATWERNHGRANGIHGGTGGGRGSARLRGTGLVEQLEADREAAGAAGDAGGGDF